MYLTQIHSVTFLPSSVLDPCHFGVVGIPIHGSMPLTNGSGSEDPNPDLYPDLAIFVTDLQDANKKLIKKQKFSCLLLFEGTVHLHYFLKIKSPKEVTK